MIEYTSGNIFHSPAVAWVNPVNCMGVSGKGLAAFFKMEFPRNFEEYSAFCRSGHMHPGVIYVHIHSGRHPTWIVNFPTKLDWRNESKLHYIRDGLKALRKWLQDEEVPSIAVPMLGCGLEGLNWANVRSLIEEHLGDLETQVLVYGLR